MSSPTFRVKLIGGPRDGEELESRLPITTGSSFISQPGGRYVVLGTPDITILDAGITPRSTICAYYTPAPREPKPSPLADDQPIGRAVLGAVGGLMWGGVVFVGLGIWAVGGWLIDELATRAGYTNLTLGLLIGGSIVGAVAGYADAKGSQ